MDSDNSNSPAKQVRDASSGDGTRLYRTDLLWIVAVVIVVVFVLSAVLLPSITRVRGPHRRTSCANNLKQMGLGMKMYANESKDEMYPPLSSVPGRLFWIPDMTPEYLPDGAVYFCPHVEEIREVAQDKWLQNQVAAISVNPMVDDWSYFYLSYAVLSDEDVEAFADFYKARVAAGERVDGDIPLMQEGESMTRTLPPDEQFSPGVAIKYDRLYRLWEGVEGQMLVGSSFRDWAVLQSRIPVMIERPGNHPSHDKNATEGCNVLFLDGHVEFMAYPGEWPMTEKTIGLLLELDALGEE